MTQSAATNQGDLMAQVRNAAVNQSSLLPDDIRQKIQTDISGNDPLMRRLDMVQVLGRDPENTLTELSYDEAIDFAILQALHDSGVIRLDGVIDFITILKRNRVPLDRKGIDEYLKGVIGQINGQIQPQAYYGSPGTVDPEKTSLMDRIAFWRN
ncbi:hypothetical protein [Methanoplanus limicola]|uniref:Uncharacterized protein n=1 Tax=Methanoplanus limicola DSM 2279 TaxID=937775 RepID=H1Z1B1_9EURY|nr:hypothetical protein [Methanoplanus limicola]EHQ35378.1 hypothetical protein Metlim_1269 [Methanoplanus limicola DSM 2279]